MNGKLYLIPTTLGDFGTIEKTIPSFNFTIIHSIRYFIVENLRSARRFLKAAGHPAEIDDLFFFELGKHTPAEALPAFLQPALDGHLTGLLSEAGTPCVADPGAEIVHIAHQLKINVVPLVGPNSLILALMASGFNGQQFVFHGYLPVDKGRLKQKIQQMERDSIQNKQTQVFIETPFRNRRLFEMLLNTCEQKTGLCIATDLTLGSEEIRTRTIADWKNERTDFDKRPAVFLIYAPL